MDDIIINDSYETIKLIINEKEYDCITAFSESDLELFFKQRDLGQSGKEVIVRSIFRNIESDENEKKEELFESIDALPDSVIETYIVKVTEGNTIMSQTYEESEGNCYDKFYIALKESRKELLKPLLSIFSETTNSNFNLDSMKINIPGYKENITQIAEIFADIVKSTIDVHQIMKPFLDQMAEFGKSISKYCTNITGALVDIIPKIKIPYFSEEEKEQIKVSYTKWAEYGWTSIPNAPISFYFNPPIDIKEANRKALKYCRKNDMEELFEKMKSISRIKQSDLDEAIFCFENKKYKSCAMILFALMDSKLIRLQKEEDKKQRKNRPSGKQAANNIKKRLSLEVEGTFYWVLEYINLFSCFEVVFKAGNDFKKQPEVINRNFLDHGMLTRNVKRMDCVQLFLLYYNFMKMLEWVK